jgi:tol-pal system-associated acyl-CoA thioesterase
MTESSGSAAAVGRLDGGTHLLPVRVYYEDTDFSGVVYHASYLRFMERGRTELLRATGVDQSELHGTEEGLSFAVRRMRIDYLKPARMDDVLTIETRTVEIAARRSSWRSGCCAAIRCWSPPTCASRRSRAGVRRASRTPCAGFSTRPMASGNPALTLRRA